MKLDLPEHLIHPLSPYYGRVHGASPTPKAVSNSTLPVRRSPAVPQARDSAAWRAARSRRAATKPTREYPTRTSAVAFPIAASIEIDDIAKDLDGILPQAAQRRNHILRRLQPQPPAFHVSDADPIAFGLDVLQ